MMAAYSLTSRQQEALRFIIGYQAAHGGISPTYNEMGKGLGVKAKSNIHYLMRSLEERGAIRRLPRRYQAIEVVAHVPIPRAHDGAPLFTVPGFSPVAITLDESLSA